MAEKIKRGRNWTCIVYPDSAPENWRDVLDEKHIQWGESPLHDKDVNPDGTKKKPHWHIALAFEGNKSYNQVLDITQELNATVPQRIESLRGLVRYFVHLDNPEKYQYSKDDIKAHGGFDIDKLMEMTSTNKLTILKDISEYILSNQVTNFGDLVLYAIHNNDEWFDIIANYNTVYVNQLINAVYQRCAAKK